MAVQAAIAWIDKRHASQCTESIDALMAARKRLREVSASKVNRDLGSGGVSEPHYSNDGGRRRMEFASVEARARYLAKCKSALRNAEESTEPLSKGEVKLSGWSPLGDQYTHMCVVQLSDPEVVVELRERPSDAVALLACRSPGASVGSQARLIVFVGWDFSKARIGERLNIAGPALVLGGTTPSPDLPFSPLREPQPGDPDFKATDPGRERIVVVRAEVISQHPAFIAARELRAREYEAQLAAAESAAQNDAREGRTVK
ncbi:MAG: hypothetical protein U0572_09800 [Phycisphaerales bacterium]